MIQFVGSMEDNVGLCVGTGTWDHHHEGHSGYLAIDIANNNLVDWLASAKPDVVMFMLGTNDITHGYDTTEIIAAYTQMVHEMRDSNPNMKIIVIFLNSARADFFLTSNQIDLVIPLHYANEEVIALNAAIPAWAKSQNSTDSPMYIADTNTGVTNDDLRDGVHPNLDGDKIIASRLYPILLQVVNQSFRESNVIEDIDSELGLV